jgi:hypothetical protein
LTRRANHLQYSIIAQSVKRKRPGTSVGATGPCGFSGRNKPVRRESFKEQEKRYRRRTGFGGSPQDLPDGLPTAFIVNSREDALQKFRNSERAGLRRITNEIDVACTRDKFHFDRIQAAQHRMRYILISIQIDFAVLVRMKLPQQFPTIG